MNSDALRARPKPAGHRPPQQRWRRGVNRSDAPSGGCALLRLLCSAGSLTTPPQRSRMVWARRAITVPAVAFVTTRRSVPGPAPAFVGQAQAGQAPAAPMEVAQVALIVPMLRHARSAIGAHALPSNVWSRSS